MHKENDVTVRTPTDDTLAMIECTMPIDDPVGTIGTAMDPTIVTFANAKVSFIGYGGSEVTIATIKGFVRGGVAEPRAGMVK